MANQRTGTTSMPQWVKVFVWVGVAAVALVMVMIASGHGPWQHMQHMTMP